MASPPEASSPAAVPVVPNVPTAALASPEDAAHERWARTEEIELRRQEIQLGRERLAVEKKWSFLRSSGGGALIGILAAALSLVGLLKQLNTQREVEADRTHQQRDAESARAKATAQIERDRLNVQIIMRAHELGASAPRGEAERFKLAARNMLWFERAGLLALPPKTVAQLEKAAGVAAGADIASLHLRPVPSGMDPDEFGSVMNWTAPYAYGSGIFSSENFSGLSRIYLSESKDEFIIQTGARLWPTDTPLAEAAGIIADANPDDPKIAIIMGTELERFLPTTLPSNTLGVRNASLSGQTQHLRVAARYPYRKGSEEGTQTLVLLSRAAYQSLNGGSLAPGLRVLIYVPKK